MLFSAHRRSISSNLAVALVVFGLHAAVSGQAVSAQDEKLKIKKANPVTVTTRDGVILRCKYYPGGVVKDSESGELEEREGKEVMPLILIHAHLEKGSVYDSLAKSLQEKGHAVIVPDLRGHGESTATRFNRRLDAEKMKPSDFPTVVNDIAAIKKFLLKENNDEKLNIELLTVVASEMGASAAVVWAIEDWSLPQLVGYKQGRDVKALALLSPRLNYNGLSIRNAVKNDLVRSMPLFIAYGGQTAKVKKDADLVEKQLERYHQADPTSLRMIKVNTTLQGTKLIDARSPVPAQLFKFLDQQIYSKASQFPWTNRKGPLEDSE